MTDAEKIAMFRVLADESDTTKTPDATVSVYLALAKSQIAHRRYPFGIPVEIVEVEGVDTEVPANPVEGYDTLHVQLAVRQFLRRGADGEKAHNETGVSRTYGSVNDEDLLSEVIQVVKV